MSEQQDGDRRLGLGRPLRTSVTRWRQAIPRVVLSVVCGGLLSACSDEPSEGEMRPLVEAHVAHQLAARHVGGFTGFATFRKQGCVATKDRPGSWDCYYNLSYAAAPGKAQGRFNGKGRFQRADNNWRYQELSAMPDDRPLLPEGR